MISDLHAAMSPCRRLVLALALALTTLGVAGCGYSTKPLYMTSVKTVTVPIFGNKTFRREWEFRLTEAIDKNIEYRTPFKVSSRDHADTILSGEIVDIQEDVLTRRFGISLPRETQVTIVVNFIWKDLRTGKVLLERKAFAKAATEIPQIGERVADAEQWAVERLAAAIVDQMQMQPSWDDEPKKQ